MQTGLQEIIAQNYNYIAGIIGGTMGFLLGVIAKLRIKYDTETKLRSEERFKAGEREFERLGEGQKRIEDKIERWEEKNQVQTATLQDAIGKFTKGLLELNKK